MTHAEALVVLGVGAGDDAATIRKAYLRAVRQHSPERDPEGFKRVRAAFEHLNSVGHWMASQAAAMPAEAAQPAAADAPEPVAIVADPLVELRLRVYSLDDDAARVCAQHAALEQGTDGAYQLWLDMLCEQEAEPRELAAVARRAIASGHPRFTTFLREVCASELVPEEREAWYAQELAAPTAVALQLAATYIDQHEAERAGELVHAVLETYRRNPMAMRAPASSVLNVVLGLFAHGPHRAAAETYRAFEAVYPVDERAGWNPVLAVATCELASVYEQLDASIVCSMAEALRNAQPQSVDRQLRVAVASGRPGTRDAHRRLMLSAPTLCALFGKTLGENETDDVAAWARSVRRHPWRLGGAVFWILFLGMRFMLHSEFRCNTASSSQAKSRSEADPVSILCDSRRALCDAARTCSAAVSCEASTEALATFNAQVKSADVDAQLSLNEMIAVDKIRKSATRYCPASDHRP